MAAVAADLRNVLIVGISAMVAAILLIAGYRARTPVVSASVVIIIGHMDISLVRLDFASDERI